MNMSDYRMYVECKMCKTQRRILRRRVLTHCLRLIHIYISQDFMKILIKFLYFCAYVLPSSVHRYRYIRIDIDNSEVYVKFCLYLDPYMHPM